MKLERIAQCVVVTLLISTRAYAVRPTVAQEQSANKRKDKAASDEPKTSPPSALTVRRGTGHIFCAYLIYLQTKLTIETCYPGMYDTLHKHVDRWIPIMRDYSDKNALSEKYNFDSLEVEKSFDDYRRKLDGQTCKIAEDSIKSLSRMVSDDPEKFDKALEQILKESDDPNQKYGCL